MRDRHQLTLFEPDSSSPTKRAGTAAWPSPGSALEQRYERFRVLAASLPVNLAWAPAPGVSRAGRASSTRENDRRRCWRGGTAQYPQHPLLRTVGIDRSYYSPVPADDLLRYAEQLPERFPCCAKAPAAVTDAALGHGSPQRKPRLPVGLAFHHRHGRAVRPILPPPSGPFILVFSAASSQSTDPSAFIENLDRFLEQVPAVFLTP